MLTHITGGLVKTPDNIRGTESKNYGHYNLKNCHLYYSETIEYTFTDANICIRIQTPFSLTDISVRGNKFSFRGNFFP